LKPFLAGAYVGATNYAYNASLPTKCGLTIENAVKETYTMAYYEDSLTTWVQMKKEKPSVNIVVEPILNINDCQYQKLSILLVGEFKEYKNNQMICKNSDGEPEMKEDNLPEERMAQVKNSNQRETEIGQEKKQGGNTVRKLVIIGSILLFPSLVFAQSAKDAIRALKKLEARCQVGIAYVDYSPALGDAKFEVNMFLETQEAKQKPDFNLSGKSLTTYNLLASSIQKTMEHYEYAQEAWQMKFGGYEYRDSIRHDDGKAKLILLLYPEADKPFYEGGVIVEINSHVWGKVKAVDISMMIGFIWNEASKELDKAMGLLRTSVNPVAPQEEKAAP